MARPTKNGLDYFPLDTVFEDKVELIKAEFGMKGLGVLITLFQRIYRNGYYTEWSQDVALMFSREVGEGVSFVSEVLEACLRRGVFNDVLYRKHKILTSKGIQERYFEIVSRRKSKIDYRYLLIPISSKKVNVAEIEVNATETRVNVNNNSAKKRKVKKSKGKESKEKYISSSSVIAQIPISADEEDKLMDLMGDEVYHRYLDKAAAFIRNGGRYKNLYQTMLEWYGEDYG